MCAHARTHAHTHTHTHNMLSREVLDAKISGAYSRRSLPQAALEGARVDVNAGARNSLPATTHTHTRTHTHTQAPADYGGSRIMEC